MALALNEEQDQLRAVTRDLLTDRATEEQVRRAMDSETGIDEGAWRTMAEIGLLGLAVEEKHGGAGAGLHEVCVVMEELGRTLAPVPYLSSVVLAATALQHSGDEDAKARWLPDVVAGERRATLAFVDPGGRWAIDATTATAAQVRGGWRVSGIKDFALDGHTADLLLVTAEAPEGLSVFAVEAGATGLTTRGLETLDPTRRLARLDLDSAPATPVGRLGGGAELVGRVLDLAFVALSAESVGGAQRVLDDTVEYARIREQFGRPIGSFQAIKHRAADMLTQVELARSLSLWARDVDESDPSAFPCAARMAKVFTGDAFFTCAAQNIQLHGGIGFTWEHSAHLYFRRAKSSQLLFGDPAQHRAAIADLLDQGATT